MAEKKGKKLRRCAKQSGYYKVQFNRTYANKKRRMARHIANHPLDTQAIDQFKNIGFGSALEFLCKGRALRRYTGVTSATVSYVRHACLG